MEMILILILVGITIYLLVSYMGKKRNQAKEAGVKQHFLPVRLSDRNSLKLASVLCYIGIVVSLFAVVGVVGVLSDGKGEGEGVGIALVGWAIGAAILNASAITFRIVGEGLDKST